jgi:hypothetical protein
MFNQAKYQAISQIWRLLLGLPIDKLPVEPEDGDAPENGNQHYFAIEDVKSVGGDETKTTEVKFYDGYRRD